MMKRDFSTSFGLVLGTIAILYGILYGGSLMLFWDIPSVLITVGGSFASVVIAFPMSTMKRLPSAVKNAFGSKFPSTTELLDHFVELSKKARREGLLALEDDIKDIDDQYMKNGLQMIVDGVEPEAIREIMELEIDEMERRHTGFVNVLKMWSNMAPAYGMIGTLIGLIQMLAQLDDQSKLASGMAVALITSFYGSVIANFIMIPIGNKLEEKTGIEIGVKSMMLEGILSIQSGVNPRVIEDKLKAYLPPEERLVLLKTRVDMEAVTEDE